MTADPTIAAGGRTVVLVGTAQTSGSGRPAVAHVQTDDHARPTPRVLLVDDDAILRGAMRELLVDYEFDVVGEASNGAEGFTLAETLTPDVVLMDLRMPVLDGIGATRRIRTELAIDVPVIVMSAYEDPSLMRDAEVAGAFCYLVKGCPARLIVDRVWDACQRRHAPCP